MSRTHHKTKKSVRTTLVAPHASSSYAAAAASSSYSAYSDDYIIAAAPASSSSSTSLIVSSAVRTECQQLIDLIAACQHGVDINAVVYSSLLPHIKTFLRASDSNAEIGAAMMLDRLRDPSLNVRMNMMHFIDYGVMRSRAFRAHIVEHFHSLLALAVGIGSGVASLLNVRSSGSASSADTSEHAVELQRLSIHYIHNWNDTYGDSVRLLRLGHEYMESKVGHLHVLSQREIDQAAQSQQQTRRSRTQQVLLMRYQRMTREFQPQVDAIEKLASEIKSSLDLLVPHIEKASEFEEFIRRPSEEEKVDDEEERPTKRTKYEPSATSTAAVVQRAPSLTLPTASSSCVSDDVEWEVEPSSNSTSLDRSTETMPSLESATSCSAAPLDTAASSSAPSNSSSSFATVPNPAFKDVHPAAAAFLEHESSFADSHWWLDGDDEEDVVDEEKVATEDGENMADEMEDAEIDDVQNESSDGAIATSVPRGYTLQIEFSSNFGVADSEVHRVVSETLRDAWQQLQKTHIPMLNEWIDTLTRVETSDSDTTPVASSSSSSTSTIPTEARDRYLLRSVGLRNELRLLLSKSLKLGIRVSMNDSTTRNEEMMHSIESSPTTAAASSSSSSTSLLRAAPVAPRSAAEIAAHTRHAAQLLLQRQRQSDRATKKIRQVKRKHAKLLEQERIERRNNSAAANAYQSAQDLRRPFSQATNKSRYEHL